MDDRESEVVADERAHILSVDDNRPIVHDLGNWRWVRGIFIASLSAAVVFLLTMFTTSIDMITLTRFASTMGAGTLERSSTDPFIPPSVLILIQTSASFATTRIQVIQDTWGARVREKRRMKLVFVSTSTFDSQDDVWTVACSDGYQEGSCKLADALVRAYDSMNNSEDCALFDWLFYGDDDIYLLPDNLQHVIVGLGPNATTKSTVYGVPGCFDRTCGGFCGGGGFLMSKQVLSVLVKTKYSALRDEFAAINKDCGFFHDIALGRLAEKNRTNITLTPYPVMPAVWDFNSREDLIASFTNKNPFAWLYHYPSRGNMDLIHNMTKLYGTNMEIHQDEM